MKRTEPVCIKILGMAREDHQLKIRIPVEMKAQVEEASAANGRTMNAEILARLQVTFDIEAAAKAGFGRPVALSEAAIIKLVEKTVRQALKAQKAEPEA